MDDQNSLTQQRQAQLRRTLNRSLIASGICRGAQPSDPSSSETPLLMIPCEISLLPYEIPVQVYDELLRASPLFNLLCDLCVQDTPWLLSAYSRIEKVDSFVQRFCDITRRVYCRSNNPKSVKDCLRGYVTRSDYFLESNDTNPSNQQIKQVEINLSSVVGISVSQELSNLHKRVIKKAQMPSNKPRSEFCSAIKQMDQTFRTKYKCTDENVSILYITGREEINFVEMMYIVEELRQSGLSVIQTDFDTFSKTYETYPDAIKVVESQPNKGERFLTVDRSYGFLDDLSSSILDSESTNTKSNDISKISVVYFRTGYGPHHYSTERHWEIRELIEDSNCIVIPSAISQLAGLKKVQQLWCRDLESISSKFCQPDIISLRSYFVDQIDLCDYLEDERTNDMINEAIQNPNGFVLKPQREGGGNNFYNDEIPDLLLKGIEDLRHAAANDHDDTAVLSASTSYILMRKINTIPRQAVFFRNGNFETVEEVISEIGIYSASLWDGDKEILNKAIGVMARSKSTSNNEGGVSIGAAVYDSVVVT